MLSLVIPTMWVNNVIVPMLQSVSGMYDELIIVDDKNENLATKINKGLAKARGDFIVVSNDDVTIAEGNLKDLCHPEKIISPIVLRGSGKAFHAHMWGMPKKAYKDAVGVLEGFSDYGKPGYFEGFNRFYYDDSDYWMKLRSAGYEPELTQSVKINHDHPGTTLATFGDNHGAEDENKNIFISRWGQDALGRVM